MRRRRKAIVSITAAIVSVCIVYGIYEIQLERLEAEEKVQIVVPTRWIEAGQSIVSEDLGYMNIAISSVQHDMYDNIDAIIGQEASIPLGINEPILAWKLNRFALHPNNGEATFQIPKEYIKAISNGIRAGDKVLIYTSGPDVLPSKVFDAAITVASVKTAANHEVDSPPNSNLQGMANNNMESMYASRREANGMIEHINLNLTEQQWIEIERLCISGEVQLVIAYHSLSSPVKGSRSP